MPIFSGFEGERFQFNGSPNKFFNLLTDETVQVNAYFNSYRNMDVIGIKLSTTCIKWAAVNERAEINNKKLNSRSYFSVDGKSYSGFAEIKFEFESAPLCLKSNDFVSCLFVNTGKYNFFITRYKNPDLLSPYLLDLGLTIRDRNVRPHGIIGQTADFSGKPKISIGEQGQGVIAGNPLDYEVSDLWTNNFKYNKFKESA
jgi:hypothetical protein